MLEPEPARAYAAAVGGVTARPAPTLAATYLLAPVVELLFRDPDLGLDLPRLVHGEQTFEFEREPRYGEALVPEGRITRIESRRHLEYLAIDLCSRDAVGAVVTRGTSLFVIRAGEPATPPPGAVP